MDSFDWIKNKTATMSDAFNTLQQYHLIMKKLQNKILQSISKIKPFINSYNWKGINYPSRKDD